MLLGSSGDLRFARARPGRGWVYPGSHWVSLGSSGAFWDHLYATPGCGWVNQVSFVSLARAMYVDGLSGAVGFIGVCPW